MNRKLVIIIPIILLLLLNNNIALGERNNDKSNSNKEKITNINKKNAGKGNGKNKISISDTTDSNTPPINDTETQSPSEDVIYNLPPPEDSNISSSIDDSDTDSLPDYSWIDVSPPEPTIKINLFSDPECQVPLSSIQWGEIEVGGLSTASLFVQNSGDVDVFISLYSENWNPNELVNFMNLYWDYDMSPLKSGEIRPITLNLEINLDCPSIEDFGFDIIIVGS
jgi:hypothetical protein